MTSKYRQSRMVRSFSGSRRGFTAQQGSLPDINCTHGNITAALTAGTTIGNITAAGTISGNITAGGNIASITARLGNLAGTVRSTGGGIGNVFVGGTMSGSLLASAGSVGTMIVCGNITSGSTISAGAGELDVLCLGNVDGSITASTDVTLVAGGTVSGDVTTSYGNVYIRSGGSILSSTISAGIDIALSARGDITSGLIFATNNVSLSAAGNIDTPDVESTETGIVTETAGNMIKGSNATAAVVDFSAYTINTSNLMGSVESSAIAHAINGSTLDGNPMVVPVCFAAGTPVLLADGTTVRIERMAEKMRVPGLPENDVSGKPIVCEVEKVFHNRPARIWHVHVAGHVIRCTALHPFYVKGKGWIHAKDLLLGDPLISNTGETLAVRKVEDSGVDEPVYNLRVKDAHTYFVALGEGGPAVLVHNVSGGTPATPTTSTNPVYGPPLPPEMKNRLDQQAQQQAQQRKANEEFAKEMTDDFLQEYGTNPYIFVPYGPQQMTPAQQKQLQIQYDAWLKQSIAAIKSHYAEGKPVPAGIVDMLDGSIAHRVIGQEYAPEEARAWIGKSINTIVRGYTANPKARVPFLGNRMFVDIHDKPEIPGVPSIEGLAVFEIKKVGIGADTAEDQALGYTAVLHLYGVPSHLGYMGSPGTEGVSLMPSADLTMKIVKWWSPRNGVILYTLTPLLTVAPKFELRPKFKPFPIPIYDPIQEILDEHGLNPRPIPEFILVRPAPTPALGSPPGSGSPSLTYIIFRISFFMANRFAWNTARDIVQGVEAMPGNARRNIGHLVDDLEAIPGGIRDFIDYALHNPPRFPRFGWYPEGRTRRAY